MNSVVDDSQDAKRWIPALIMVLSGLAILLMALVESADRLPFSMPRSWYSNRWMWILAAVGMVYAGIRMYSTSAVAQMRIDGRQFLFKSVVVYTRQGCHLCDDAMALLKRDQHLFPPIEVVDIDASPDLVEQFNTCVPVVEVDGKVRFRGRVNEALWKRLIEGTRRRRFQNNSANTPHTDQ